MFRPAVFIGRGAAVRGKRYIRVFQDVVLFVHNRQFTADKQKGAAVIQHTNLVRRHKLTPGNLIIRAVITVTPRRFAVGVGVNGGLAEIGFGNQLVGRGFVAAEVKKLVAVA